MITCTDTSSLTLWMQFDIQPIHINRETHGTQGKSLAYVQAGPPLHLAPAMWCSKCELLLKIHFRQTKRPEVQVSYHVPPDYGKPSL